MTLDGEPAIDVSSHRLIDFLILHGGERDAVACSLINHDTLDLLCLYTLYDGQQTYHKEMLHSFTIFDYSFQEKMYYPMSSAKSAITLSGNCSS